MDKQSHKGFKVGQAIMLKESIRWDSAHYDAGHTGVITGFPCYTHRVGHYVKLELTNYDYPVCCELIQIIKDKGGF